MTDIVIEAHAGEMVDGVSVRAIAVKQQVGALQKVFINHNDTQVEVKYTDTPADVYRKWHQAREALHQETHVSFHLEKIMRAALVDPHGGKGSMITILGGAAQQCALNGKDVWARALNEMVHQIRHGEA